MTGSIGVPGAQVDWRVLSRRAAFASHQLIGWIYWEPRATSAYEALGIPNGTGYYVTSRAGRLGDAGADVVAAAYYSIHAGFVAASYDLLFAKATTADAIRVRDHAVAAGLREYVPGICDHLASMSTVLWDAADALPSSGRVLFAAQLSHRRPDDPLLDAWLAVNCIREWRGDSHWIVHAGEGLTGTEAGVLDGAWRSYADDWLPRSRGADDEALASAYKGLADRGLASHGQVTADAIAYRQELEDRLDDMAALAWQHLGAEQTQQFVDLIGSAGNLLMGRIDATAGEKWMPAGRRHPGIPD